GDVTRQELAERHDAVGVDLRGNAHETARLERGKGDERNLRTSFTDRAALGDNAKGWGSAQFGQFRRDAAERIDGGITTELAELPDQLGDFLAVNDRHRNVGRGERG